MFLTIIMLIFLVLLVAGMIFTTFIIWRYYRIETYAVMMNKDGHRDVLKINPNKDHFRYAKGSYVIPQDKKFFMRLHRKYYLRYMEGSPEPFVWYTDDKPAIRSDVFKSIIESSGLKLLNTSPLSFDWKMILIIGVAVLIAIFVITKLGSGGSVV